MSSNIIFNTIPASSSSTSNNSNSNNNSENPSARKKRKKRPRPESCGRQVYDLCGTTQDAEQAYLADTSREGYIGTLVQLVKFCYTTGRKRYIRDVSAMEEAEGEEGERGLTAEIQKQLVAMNSRDRNPVLNLEGEGVVD